ncbi:unnamed protein product [Pleuronectes platessa]|uniref:Uncharacterized protein n=1 Tax=Pleuronectes platessa TaxID=8262 RepID=A0A9N7VEJ0_PLEPL|nr:unnamed protein product [Pleuronectes platessa]
MEGTLRRRRGESNWQNVNEPRCRGDTVHGRRLQMKNAFEQRFRAGHGGFEENLKCEVGNSQVEGSDRAGAGGRSASLCAWKRRQAVCCQECVLCECVGAFIPGDVMLLEQTVLREGRPPPAAGAATPAVPGQPRANASDTADANARSPPAPRLGRADVTQLPSTSHERMHHHHHRHHQRLLASLTGSRAGMPRRRHPTCEERGGGGGGGASRRDGEGEDGRKECTVWERLSIFRTPSIASPSSLRGAHLSRTNTTATHMPHAQTHKHMHTLIPDPSPPLPCTRYSSVPPSQRHGSYLQGGGRPVSITSQYKGPGRQGLAVGMGDNGIEVICLSIFLPPLQIRLSEKPNRKERGRNQARGGTRLMRRGGRRTIPTAHAVSRAGGQGVPEVRGEGSPRGNLTDYRLFEKGNKGQCRG